MMTSLRSSFLANAEAIFRLLEQEVDDATLGDHEKMEADRRARVKETMGDLLRLRSEEVPRAVVGEINLNASAEVSPFEMQRLERGKQGRLCSRWCPLRSWMTQGFGLRIMF